MCLLKQFRAKKAARNKVVLATGAVMGALATFLAMKLLGKFKCLFCFKRLLARKK